MADANGNGNGRIWKWRKVDLLFILGVLIIARGLQLGDLGFVSAGIGLLIIPITQRGEK